MGLKPRLIQRGTHSQSPGPFDLGDRIASTEHHPARGAFSRVYHISDLTRDEVELLALWLCNNCVENFIFTESKTRILAGGSTNPLLSWQQRHMDRYQHSSSVDGYNIKLHEEDVLFFELAWMHGSES